jgi:transposase InsO family protein
MLHRWVDLLCSFDFEIVHVPGRENVVADALSRQYDKWCMGRTVKSNATGDLIGVVAAVSAQVEDVVHGREMARELSKQFVEPGQRQALLAELHKLGHFSVEKMYAYIFHEKGSWWSGIRKDCRELMANCIPCQKVNVVEQGYHPLKAIGSHEPWELLALDTGLAVPETPEGFKVLLVVVDTFTRMVVLRALKDKCMETVAYELLRIFADFGMPRTLQHDAGREFLNWIAEAMERGLGIGRRVVAEYAHQANGAAERTVRTVYQVILKTVQGDSVAWAKFLPVTQMVVNMAVNATTGSAPFSLLFGRQFNWGGARSGDAAVDCAITDEDIASWKAKTRWVIQVVYPAMIERSGKRRKATNDRRSQGRRLVATPLAIGTIVYARNVNQSGKFDPIYEGPLEVVGIDDKGAYALRGPEGGLVGRHVTIDQLKVTAAKNLVDGFIVEKILAKKIGKDKEELYLVQWKGLATEENSWEPKRHFYDWKVIEEFEKREREKAASLEGL